MLDLAMLAVNFTTLAVEVSETDTASKSLNFLSIDTGTIIAVLLNTLILFFIIKKLLFEKVNKVIENRQKEVTDTFDEANTANENAKNLEAEYSSKISLAKEESAEIVKNATKKALSRSDDIIAEAKLEANNVLDKANAEIEREKKRAVNQIKDEISDMAFMVASKVINKELDQKQNDILIEEFIQNVGEI